MDTLGFIPPGHPKTQGVCERAVEKDPWQLKDVLYHFKTEKMCERAVEAGYSNLTLVTSRQEKCVEKWCAWSHAT